MALNCVSKYENSRKTLHYLMESLPYIKSSKRKRGDFHETTNKFSSYLNTHLSNFSLLEFLFEK